MTLSDILPARLRYGIYVALVVIGVALGSIQAWCTAAGIDVPTWHAPALAVLGYLSAAVGLVAAANVTPGGLTPDEAALIRDIRQVEGRDTPQRRHDDA